MAEKDESNLYVYIYSDLDDDFVFAETKYTLEYLHKLQKENEILKWQQKEFIKWLNEIINNLGKQQTRRFNHSYQYKLDAFKSILSKYEKIIKDSE